MAARTRKLLHDEETRARIKISQLINRLSAHAFGKVELSQTQVRAIEVLIRKRLPDLTSMAHTGPDGKGPVEITRIERTIVRPPNRDG